MSLEPSFILHASDPAAAGALREYITIRKRQGATSLELDRLHAILLEFAGWVREQSRPPMVQATVPVKKPVPDPVAADLDAVREHVNHNKPLPQGFKKKGGKR